MRLCSHRNPEWGSFQSNAQLILYEPGEYLGYSAPPLLERLIEDGQKIHQQRLIFKETLAPVTQAGCEPK